MTRTAAPTGPIPVGTVARRSRKVTARDIALFMTGDRNPLHYDEAAAAATRFGGIIVQGGVTSGLVNAVVAEDLPGPGSVFLHVDWSLTAPVRPGDTITAEVEVLSNRPDKPVHEVRTTVRNQHEDVVLDGRATVYRVPLTGQGSASPDRDTALAPLALSMPGEVWELRTTPRAHAPSGWSSRV